VLSRLIYRQESEGRKGEGEKGRRGDELLLRLGKLRHGEPVVVIGENITHFKACTFAKLLNIFI